MMKEKLVDCPVCGGDGKERCDNPDHGFIEMMSGEVGRLVCPVCGHDPDYKVPGGNECWECGGSGNVTVKQWEEYTGDCNE